MSVEELMSSEYARLSDLLAAQAREQPDHAALVDGERSLDYRGLDLLMDRIAAALQRDGVALADTAAICATTSLEYAAAFVGILRAGGVAAPLAPSSTAESLAGQLKDCDAKVLFLDKGVAEQLAGVADQITAKRVALDGSDAGVAFAEWLAPAGARPSPTAPPPEQAFNIIYSSGTTGAPKGIIQSHGMRWAHIHRASYAGDPVTMISTPLYSNTTLVSFLPTLAHGGVVVLLPKFDAGRFLQLAQTHRATHAMLVPVQYRRLLAQPDFDSYDLSSFVMKFVTSAPFSAADKAEVLRRWPGGLTEFYGMTEGGATCVLLAHEHPDKLHTVGRPLAGHVLKLIDDEGREVGAGEVGEIVGRSIAMMNGYHNQPQKTREAEWFDPQGLRYIRTGDVGRMDEDGFITLMDRKKDMIISGGFNVYPSDLEAILLTHADVQEAAVVGVPSERWGETPVAFVALKPGAGVGAESLRGWFDAQVGKTQRLADLQVVDHLPRSHIGKVLKRDLRDAYRGAATAA